jgi:hypothetical protein
VCLASRVQSQAAAETSGWELCNARVFQKARTGDREITTQDAVSPIEGIQMDDNLREKTVDIGRLVRHEESQEFLEDLKHQRQSVMLYDATRLASLVASNTFGNVCSKTEVIRPPRNGFHVVNNS